MANAKKCDRCGAYYQSQKPIKAHLVTQPDYEKNAREISLASRSVSVSYSVDLCPECVDELVRYFNDGWRK